QAVYICHSLLSEGDPSIFVWHGAHRRLNLEPIRLLDCMVRLLECMNTKGKIRSCGPHPINILVTDYVSNVLSMAWPTMCAIKSDKKTTSLPMRHCIAW